MRMAVIALFAASVPAACAPKASAPAAAAPAAPAIAEPARTAGLERAFEVARRFPERAFIKDRAKYEGVVVDACLALGDVPAATAFADRSCFTWRRCESLALVADRLAERGDADAARALAGRAMSELARLEEVRDWAAERVRATVAQVHLRLGDAAAAAAVMPADAPALQAASLAFRAQVAPPSELGALADAFDQGIATNAFDLARSGLDGYHAILRRAGGDGALRERAAKALDAGIPGLPYDLQVEYRVRSAEAFGAIGLPGDARAQVGRADEAFRAARFVAEDESPVGARLAVAMDRFGDRAGAEATLAALEASYRREVASIVDIRRARCLRSLAEAWASLGDAARAQGLYADAVEAGALNPNARPRAEDLCDTLVSMARSGTPALPAVRARIDAIEAGLRDPW